MDARIAEISTLPQKDRPTAYQALVADIFSRPQSPSIVRDVHALADAVTQDNVVVGRAILTTLAERLSEGAALNSVTRKQIVEDILATVQSRLVSYEEQVNALRFVLADIFEKEEEWEQAAHVLMGISPDAGQRPDAEKLALYVRIMRLLLEVEDSVQAETYYNRAASLTHTTNDKVLLLSYKLCQARIHDYSRRFLEAAIRYHELSWVAEIDEEERKQMLSAAATCAVLAPAGPNRSRVLAALCRDERAAELPTYNILSKMFLDRILRSAEVAEFQGKLKPHQLAKIAISSSDRLASAISEDDAADDPSASRRRGPETVLDRAVMEHNLLASSKIYNNITFKGLGALLDLTPGAAETMARRMIEQGRLKGSIDQVERLIVFDVDGEEDDAQGKAGGLGDVEQVTEDTGAPFTKRWDMQIRITSANVESIVQHLTEKGLVKFEAVQV